MEVAKYFIINFNVVTHRELITWLLRNKDIYESPAFAARREMYICMEKLKKGKRSEKLRRHAEKMKKTGGEE